MWPFIVDFLVSGKLVVEVQGRYWHSKSRRIEKDQVKRECLEAEGYVVYAVYDDILRKEPDVVEESLKRLISQIFYPQTTYSPLMW